jgi:hypothetical protein
LAVEGIIIDLEKVNVESLTLGELFEDSVEGTVNVSWLAFDDFP